MKKIYLTLTSTLFVASLFAQAPISTNGLNEAPKNRADRPVRQLNTNNANRSTIVNQKVNFIDMSTSFYSSTPDYDLYYVFPDSTPLADYGGTYDFPFVSSMGMTFDLTSDVINAGVGSSVDRFVNDAAYPITIDSIAAYCGYTQGRDGFVDTVIYRVITPSAANLSRQFFFTGTSANYPLSNDTTRFLQLLRTPTGNPTGATPGVIAEYKVPLRLADTTANGLQYPIAITGGLTVPARFAITIDYKPGGTYTPFVDTMGERIGSFSIYTAELNGDQTFSNYIPGDFTGSSWVENTSKYNATSSWYGWYLPYLAYGAGIFESIDLDISVSQTNPVSVKEIENGAKLFQNYPNPATGFTTVKYELGNQSNVSFELMDVTGKKVISLNEGNKNAGTHTIEINTNDLNAGIYFYSVVVNGQPITKKMTITK